MVIAFARLHSTAPRSTTRITTPRRQPQLALLAALVLSGSWCTSLLGATEKAAAFSELAAACRPLEAFVVDNRITVGADVPLGARDSGRIRAYSRSTSSCDASCSRATSHCVPAWRA